MRGNRLEYQMLRVRHFPHISMIDFSQARQTRIIEGVKLGMSDCVVDDDGVFIAPSKMTTMELQVSLYCMARDVEVWRNIFFVYFLVSFHHYVPDPIQVESEANGLPVDGLTRTQLSRQVKARREALPAKVGDRQ